MLVLRDPDTIARVTVPVANGVCDGRWHFSFGDYHDPRHMGFGHLRVLNDDTLSPGATWPLHPHREIEVVTYCAGGVFRHEDERGRGDVLREGWVQHTTVGRGMMHAEINDRADEPMRFLQLWITPRQRGLEPALQQRAVDPVERTNRWLPLVSNEDPGALPLAQDARVLASRLDPGTRLEHGFRGGRGGYLYVVKGGPVRLGDADRRLELPEGGAAEVTGEARLVLRADAQAELLLVET